MNIKNLKINDKVKIKYFTEKPNHWNKKGKMDEWQGKEVTIKSVTIELIELTNYAEIYVFENYWMWYPSDFEDINNSNNPNQYLLCKK